MILQKLSMLDDKKMIESDQIVMYSKFYPEEFPENFLFKFHHKNSHSQSWLMEKLRTW